MSKNKLNSFEVWPIGEKRRTPPVADAVSRFEWQQLGDWRVGCANDDRALVATGSAQDTAF